MVHFDVLSEQDIDPIIAVELSELKENKVLMVRIKRERLIGWLKVKSSHSLLFEKVDPFSFSPPPDWLRQDFLQQMIYSQCNLQQIEKRGDLHLKMNQSLEVQQCNQESGFIFSTFCFRK